MIVISELVNMVFRCWYSEWASEMRRLLWECGLALFSSADAIAEEQDA
jgi:hypothetical protein